MTSTGSLGRSTGHTPGTGGNLPCRRHPAPASPRRKLAVELFSGTAGATAAFRGRPDWDVITVDLDPRHRPTVVADCSQLPFSLGPDVGRPLELLWMSPPCQQFSRWNRNAPLRPSLEMMFAAFTAVQQYRPRYWVLENVLGAIPFLGIPAQKIGPWCLWGYFPQLAVDLVMHDHRKSDQRTAVARAAVPRAVSDALLAALIQADGLTSLLDLRPFRRHRHVKARPSVSSSTATFDLFAAERPETSREDSPGAAIQATAIPEHRGKSTPRKTAARRQRGR